MMVKFSRRFSFATTIALLTLGAIDLPQTHAASLYLGLSQYVENIKLNKDLNNLEETQLFSYLDLDISQKLLDSKDENLIDNNQENSNQNSEEVAVTVEEHLENIQNKINTENQEIIRRNTTEQNLQFSSPEDINKQIADRYDNLVEEQTDSISLIENQKTLKEQILLEENKQNERENTEFMQSDSLFVDRQSEEAKIEQIPKPILYSLILLFGLWSIPTLKYVSATFIFGEEGIIKDFQDKYGKPKVPEGTVFMHDRSFKELEKIAVQLARINSEKFGSDEFILFVKIKQSIQKGKEEFKKLEHRAELLKVAIAAQSSFLRIEQTELRFRSRNQQEFYQNIVDSLEQNLDKDIFRDRVKRKLSEILPLVNTEEGRNALQAYLKDLIKISEHKLGLKLLSLFKQYQLADFTILKRVSDIVNQLKGQDLLKAKNLISLAIENYEIFEKLAPIIGVAESENSPETYANILQYIGLISRYERSYEYFQQLLETLKQWQKPYKTIQMIRQEYPASEYRLPPEFSQEIPGLNIYQKYENFLDNN